MKNHPWFSAEAGRIVLTILSAAALLWSLLGGSNAVLPFDPAWTAILLCGVPILIHAIGALIFERDIKADTLVSIALLGALYLGEYFAAGEVALIMQIGSILEDYTAGKARRGIEKLLKLKPQTARLRTEEGERIVPVGEVRPGDRLAVLAGETIPVDGVILSGTTAVDQSSMTGESMPLDKTVGDEVAGGTVNVCGVFEMTALREEKESFLQRVIQLTNEADAHKAKIVSRADRWATWMVIAALAASVMTGLVTGELIRAVTVLVVFCPCAFVLATPTAIMAGIGSAARRGILIRSGDSLERFADITIVAFDKTGTLTVGRPDLIECRSVDSGLSDETLLRLAAAAERDSEHPLGRAIRSAAERRGIPSEKSVDFEATAGLGIRAVVDGRRVTIGNEKFLNGEKITAVEKWRTAAESDRFQNATLLYVGVDGVAAGILALSDTLRPTSAVAISRLKKMGVTPCLFTGDSASAANRLAESLGIAWMESELLPKDKMERVATLSTGRQRVCMVGDGVNDAPALRAADAGIAMGGVGSDIAVESSDAVLVGDDPAQIPDLLQLAQKTMRTINGNIAFSMGLNFLAVILAAVGILNPVWGALVHNAGSVAVVLNSVFLFSSRKP